MYLKQVGRSDRSITLIPGGPCLPGYLHKLRDLLATQFQVNELDLRDSSLSPVGPPFSIEGCFDDIDLALKGTTKKIFLLGHSAGAVCTLAYAARRKPDISGLILLNPGPLTANAQKIFADEVNRRNRKLNPHYDEMIIELEKNFSEATGEEKSKAFLAEMDIYWPAYFTALKKPEILFRLPKAEAIEPMLSDYYHWKDEGKFLEAWETIPFPVHMIHSDFDPIPFEETKNLMAGRIKYFDFSLIKGAGHFPWYERPSELLALIVNWVENLK